MSVTKSVSIQLNHINAVALKGTDSLPMKAHV